MAVRPVFCVNNGPPYVNIVDTEFTFYSGFSITQKQKSINSLHDSFLQQNCGEKVLEISSKSKEELGVKLSAFNLKIKTSFREFSVENAFQSSKVFEHGGPYLDLLEVSPKEAKKDFRIRNSGKLIKFRYFQTEYPLNPKDYFYNWLYINSLRINSDLIQDLDTYSAFTDIEFNPERSLNCQAKAAAIFVSLKRMNLLEVAMSSHEDFLRIVYGSDKSSDKYSQISMNFNY